MFIKNTINQMRAEFRQLRKSPLPLITALVLPLAAWLLLALTFQNSAVENIPVIVVDKDNTSSSRLAINSLDATRYLNIKSIMQTDSKAKEMFAAQEVYFIIYIPDGFEKALKTGGSSEVSIVSNGAVLLYTKVGYKAIAQTLSTLSAGISIKRLEAKGLTADEALAKVNPVSTEISIFGNPYLDYAIYLIPGMLFAILQMSASFSALWLFRTHREHKAARIIPHKPHIMPMLTSRIVLLVSTNIIAVILIFILIFPIAGIPSNSQLVNIFLLTILLTIVSIGMGAFVSLLFGNLVSATQLLLIINAPSFVFSGYTFPTWAMPEPIMMLSKLIPLTHFFDGFFPMFLFDSFTWRGVIPLLIIGAVLWGGVFLVVFAANKYSFVRKMFIKKEA